jgi:hypothetical protein
MRDADPVDVAFAMAHSALVNASREPGLTEMAGRWLARALEQAVQGLFVAWDYPVLARKVQRHFESVMAAHVQPADADLIRAVWEDEGRSHPDLDLNTAIAEGCAASRWSSRWAGSDSARAESSGVSWRSPNRRSMDPGNRRTGGIISECCLTWRPCRYHQAITAMGGPHGKPSGYGACPPLPLRSARSRATSAPPLASSPWPASSMPALGTWSTGSAL